MTLSPNLFILLALASAAAGAVATSLGRKVMKYLGNSPEDYMPVHYAVLTAALLPGLVFFFHLELTPLLAGVFLMALFLDGLGNYFYIRSFQRQHAHRISVIMALSPVFGIMVLPFLGPLAKGNMLDWGQAGGIAVILAGLVVMSGEWTRRSEVADDEMGIATADRLGTVYSLSSFRDRMESAAHQVSDAARQLNHRRIKFPVAAAALLGVNALLMKFLFTGGAMNPYTYYTLRCAALALVFTLLFRPNFKEFLGTGENAKWTWLRAGFVAAQWLLMLYAISLGNPLVASAISGTVPLFVVIIAFLVWKVKVRWYEMLGTLIVVAGVVLVLAT